MGFGEEKRTNNSSRHSGTVEWPDGDGDGDGDRLGLGLELEFRLDTRTAVC